MSKRQLLLYSLSAILLIYAVFDYVDYQKQNLDVTGFYFVCNPSVCEIRHKKANGEIKYVEKIDINQIESFSTETQKIPRVGGSGLVIYANCKDGTRFRLSPIYVRTSRYVDMELINPLNQALHKNPVDIRISFPR